MGSFMFRAGLIVLLATRVTSALRPYRYLDILNNKQRFASSRNNKLSSEVNDVQELFFSQRLDHFDPLNLETYEQRYFYSNRYVDSSAVTSFTFLCVGGEGPGFDKGVLLDSDHCTGDMIALASKLFHDYQISVHMYALEHRYYGRSYPNFGDQSPVETQNLKYLSSKQALEDLAHFVQTMQAQEANATTTKWVSFGGSYPGYMAGNARLKHPQLIFAAVSSSVPLDLEVDFPGYNERVGWDLAYKKVGGSPECFEIVKNGHREAVALLDRNRTHLAEQFQICHPETALDRIENQKLFLGDGLIEIYVQGNDPSCDEELCNIERLCSFMIESKAVNSTKSNLDVLVDVAMAQRNGDTECRSFDFQDLLDELARPVVDYGGWRSWLWQTCTEVGFYQTCIHETCPYATHFHTVDQDLAICQAAYNITNVYDNVQATRDYYGGLDISSGSRVLTVNGNVDPWSVLGLHESPKFSLPVEMVNGASHHFWTHEIKDTDGPEIHQIREYVYSTVMNWLGVDETMKIERTSLAKTTTTTLNQY